MIFRFSMQQGTELLQKFRREFAQCFKVVGCSFHICLRQVFSGIFRISVYETATLKYPEK